MKVYSDTLTDADLDAATTAASSHNPAPSGDYQFTGIVGFETCRKMTRPQIRKRGWDVRLYRIGSTRHFNTGQWGAGDDGAASYDDYGWFIAELFARDPQARIAEYDGAANFHTVTNDAFKPEDNGGSPRMLTGQLRTRLAELGFERGDAGQLVETARQSWRGHVAHAPDGRAWRIQRGNGGRFQVTEVPADEETVLL